ncbi:MAG: ring-cleaving dioxygenase [Neomegalonema sp.]|nr:ring-cleaving dioxygenase [Neomegalonema sp.]
MPTAGLHHITAISNGAQKNLDFYTQVLGLRFIKKTVNFDDPTVYHLYFGDELGSPGTAMTFFPWEHLPQGRIGTGQVSITQFAVPPGALDFWRTHFDETGTPIASDEVLFDEKRLVIEDPDGLLLALVETDDPRAPWTGSGIGSDHAIRGFHGATLSITEERKLAGILTEVFGYTRESEQSFAAGSQIRYRAASGAASVLDLHVAPGMARGQEAAGTVHHIAFSVPDETAQAEVREALLARGQHVTEVIDRDYFKAIYFRTPTGILFEVATDTPGFTVDEPKESLGQRLCLPAQHEPHRAQIEASLPELVTG